MKRLILILAMAATLSACSSQRKITQMRESGLTARLSLPSDVDEKPRPELKVGTVKRDTLKVRDSEGNEMLIMKAVKDENGEMVATDVIDAAVVTARFRNVAERHGRVDICFDVTVPKAMESSRWQLRFYPVMRILGDSLMLDPVIITGREYRRAQLRGYEQYRHFLSTIITDSTKLVDIFQLENFLRRNIPEIYAFKTDSSFVSDEDFASAYGVNEKQAVDHYARRFRIWRNERRIGRKEAMFRRFVKVPINKEGLRLDTVLVNSDEDFVYSYVQTIVTRPKLRKVGIELSGEIYEQDRKVYHIPESEPLTFYISSLSTLVDETERYLSQVVERKAEANTACYIEFSKARSDIETGLGHNAEETGRIKANLTSLLENKTYDLDSIVVTASCSPEGGLSYNTELSQRRAEAVSAYFRKYMHHCLDSLRREEGIVMDLSGDYEGLTDVSSIPFISRSNPENWTFLDRLVETDDSLGQDEKAAYVRLSSLSDPDEREREMRLLPSYRYLREKLYPRLRTVAFDFHLHRRGMVKDTIHTTVLDTAYARGVQAIRDRDYSTAVKLLSPYRDFNTAVAYCALDRNASAMDILKGLEKTGKVLYMMALLYSRSGDDQAAVQCYMDACSKDRAFVSRGNLDPEISVLIKRYTLNKDIDFQ